MIQVGASEKSFADVALAQSLLDGIPPWALWAGGGFLAAVALVVTYFKVRKPLARKFPWLTKWLPTLFPPPPVEVSADDRFSGPDLFPRIVGYHRRRIKRYLRQKFGGRINVNQVFRSATLELWHNAPDIDNYLHAVDSANKTTMDEGEWFRRIAHNFARDYIERHGNLEHTAQGVFLDFVAHELGIWGRLGFKRDSRLPELTIRFHEKVMALPPDLKQILEEDLNTDLLVVAERRFGQFHSERRKAVAFLRHSLGLSGERPASAG
jgi:DNA-directed RNA polymerase specialized sigma24 family protein